MPHVTRRGFVLTSLAVLTAPRWAQADDAPPFRFGMLTDAHYADYDSRGTRHYRQSLAKMQECVERMNDEKVAFLVELGDFNDGARHPSEEDALGYLDAIEDEFARFTGPRYHALGNHNMDALSKPQVLGRLENTGIDTSRSYYSFDHGGLHFVVLDPNFRGDGAAYDRGDYQWTDANLPASQIDWLQQDLADARKPTIVFLHQLLDGEGALYVNNAAAVRKVLEASGNTLAVFQGHHHAGGYRQIEGIHYYTLRAMVEGAGPENNAYAVVEVGPGRIVVEGYRRAADRTMEARAAANSE